MTLHLIPEPEEKGSELLRDFNCKMTTAALIAVRCQLAALDLMLRELDNDGITDVAIAQDPSGVELSGNESEGR